MAKEHVLNPEIQDADKEQKPVEKKEDQIQINLATSLIITPMIKFIGEIKQEVQQGANPIFSLVLVTDAIELKFTGKLQAIRGLKAGLLNALTQNQIYIVNVSESLIEEGDLMYEVL